MKHKCAIFDLDGVLVDTAKYHYLAWRQLAEELGFQFTREDNERLKGVSRMASLQILLECGGLRGRFSQAEEERMAAEKNRRYVEYISHMGRDELLEGALSTLQTLRGQGIKVVLGSASKNAPLILENLGIAPLFDVVVDGNSVSKAKPDPEVFTRGAEQAGVPYGECAVFEDALAGIQAAKAAGMTAVGIGAPENLPGADAVYGNLGSVELQRFF